MKLTALQIHEAFQRAAHGESVRGIAASLGVTEGALRWHFRKPTATPPREVRRIAWALFEAEQACRSMGLSVEQVKRLAGI